MKRAIIVHGWEGNPEKDWYPWLKTELEKAGYEVFVPQMPDSDNPVIEDWVGKLAEVVGTPDANTYFIGHSVGAQTILRYLESVSEPVGGAVFVAAWFDLDNLEDEETEAIAKPWLERPINITKIKAVLPASVLIISDNDPFGCFEENRKRFAALGVKEIVLHDAGHITSRSGFKELPVALKAVLDLRTTS